MAFRLASNETVAAGIKRAVREQVDKAIAEMDDRKLARDEAVHQVRKRCKKIRAALRLVRPALGTQYQKENRWYRDTARLLAGWRDAAVLVETFDALLERFAKQTDREHFQSLRAAFVHQRQRAARKATKQNQRLKKVRTRLVVARKRIAHWTLDPNDFSAVAGGLQKTYRRARKATARAEQEPQPENFHDWRKRAKYHRYQLRLLNKLWPARLNPWRQELQTLSDDLGDEHDLVLLRRALLDSGQPSAAKRDRQLLVGLIDRRRRELQSRALAEGKRLFAESPKSLRKRFRRYWQVWRQK